LNICIITSSFPSNPNDFVQAPFLLPFVEGLKKRGHSVSVFTQERGGVEKAFWHGVEVNWFSWRGSQRPLVSLNPLNPRDGLRIGSLLHNGKKALLPFLKEYRIDACLALWVLPGGYFANHARRRLGIPYSVWALGSDIHRYGKNPLIGWMMNRIVQEAAGVFADGFELSKEVESLFGRKCFYLASTRTLKINRTPDPTAETGPSNRKYCFLFVGRLEKVKGIDILLQSAAALSEKGKEFLVRIVGTGSREPWARDFVVRKGIGENVLFEGNVPDQRLTGLYLSSDCVVIPSRSESIPLVFSEALMLDKDLIVTEVGDMGLLGRRYEVARVIPPEDSAALEEAMGERIERGSRGRKDTAKRDELRKLFNIETSVDRFLADYK